jgi:hypothetical protein
VVVVTIAPQVAFRSCRGEVRSFLWELDGRKSRACTTMIVSRTHRKCRNEMRSGVDVLYMSHLRTTHTRGTISRHPYPRLDGQPSPAQWLGITVGRGKARLSYHLLTAVKITCPTKESVRLGQSICARNPTYLARLIAVGCFRIIGINHA